MITATTIKMPTPIPVLKIPPITLHEFNNIERIAKERMRGSVDFFIFIIFIILIYLIKASTLLASVSRLMAFKYI